MGVIRGASPEEERLWRQQSEALGSDMVRFQQANQITDLTRKLEIAREALEEIGSCKVPFVADCIDAARQALAQIDTKEN